MTHQYKGFTIWPRNVYGMYRATNFCEGYPQLAADTLQGMREIITHYVNERKR